jgi:flagellar basal-body rod modification protein FlgD
MSIYSIEQASAAAGLGPANNTGGSTELGKNEFLKLLVAQMQHQDPMDPMDNSELTAQLAQFSSLEQLFTVNANLEGLVEGQTPSGMGSVASFLDREVVANGDRTQISGGVASPIQFSLDGPAEIVTVTVFDDNGTSIGKIPLGAQPGGLNQVQWDGIDSNGNVVADGRYSFAVTAQDEAGSTVATRTEVRGLVTGASYENGESYLTVGSQRVALIDVIEVNTVAPP